MNRPEIAQPCPDPEAWVRCAAGIFATGEQESLLDHVAKCAACASRLRDLINAVSGHEPVDFEARAAIDALSVRLDQKRRTLSRRMAGGQGSSTSGKYWMLSIAAGLAILLAGGWLVYTRLRSTPPLELLATAYTSRRTMDLRIPGARYAPLQVPRSATDLSDLPRALLESQIQIEHHLETRQEDPEWLHAQGRAQLLLWQFDAAIRSFQAAADLGANSPDFLIDYASAYYQRAERNSTALDYALALEKLGQALKQQPDDPAALFNSGIVHAKLHQYDSAIEDFERCLRVQTDPKWKGEAQTRLNEVKRLKTAVFDPNRAPSSQFRAERDLETAMTFDLAGFFDGHSSNVEHTAAAMVGQNKDRWLGELIRLPHTPENVRAVESLSRLTRLRVNYNTGDEGAASEIGWLRSASLPLPLRVWRDYEILYRDARSSAVATCAADAQRLIGDVSRYPWMEAQILLESSLCSAATQDFAGAAALVDRAERLADERKLVATSIRIPNFRGQRLAETGYFREAAQAASDALSRMETGSYPPRRAYDFYGIMMLVASQLNLPNTGYGASRMMAAVGESCGIRFFEMVGQCRRAGFALSLGLDAEATTALQTAQAALASLGDDPTARIYWRTSEVGWLETHQDRQALYRMLEEAHREGPAKKENLYFNRKLIAALCRLESRVGHRSEVERMANQFWNDAADDHALSPGALRAFRPDLESVSQSLTRSRLEDGDENGALEAWRRFLTFDWRLLGGSEDRSASDNRAGEIAILTVAVVGDKVAVWLGSGGQNRFHWASESYSELGRRIRKLRRLCRMGTSVERISSEARSLYRILFPDGIGTASHVYIRTRGMFEMIPPATFMLAGEGRSAAFSFLLFGERPQPAMTIPGTNAHMTVVAATKIDSSLGLPALPDDEINGEIAAARQAFADTAVIRGADATAGALEQAAMNSQALHFTGHAAPWRGAIGLLVSPDASDGTADGRAGFWSMGRPRSVNADMVVLSACNTGAFEDQATVEPGQLAVSMLLAGAHQVVASLWDVDSSATSAWNRAFYRRIAQGDPPANAMKLASEQLRVTPQWQSPKYWAGFALYER